MADEENGKNGRGMRHAPSEGGIFVVQEQFVRTPHFGMLGERIVGV